MTTTQKEELFPIQSTQKRARHLEIRAWREYIHALPLTSKLDALCGGICEPDSAACGGIARTDEV